jgi:hypothetical protein
MLSSSIVMAGLLAVLGETLPGRVRWAAWISAGALIAGLSVAQSLWERPRPFQRDRETPQWLLAAAPGVAAFVNGAYLGTGFATRVGFWAWYLIPAAALLAGSPLAAVAVCAAYATSRSLGVLQIIALGRRYGTLDEVGSVLALGSGHARALASSLGLVVVAVTCWSAVG